MRAIAGVTLALVLVLVALIALPPVIRISLPALPALHLPRVEFVHVTPITRAPHAPTAAITPTPRPIAIVTPPDTFTHPVAARPNTQPPAPTGHAPDLFVVAPAHVVPAAQMITSAPQPPAVRAHANAAPHATPPGAHIVTTPAPAAPTPATPKHDPQENPDSADWPLLCGEVLDESGQPVAGARVALADLDLSARSDRHGHFCIAAPPGDRTLSVLAQGFGTFRTVVTLAPTGSELHVSLKAAP